MGSYCPKIKRGIMDIRRQYSKASKYLAKKDIPFEGEDLDLVKMLMTDAFLAGIEQGQELPISNVVEPKRKLVCGHPNDKVYLKDGFYHCEECNGKWKSLTN